MTGSSRRRGLRRGRIAVAGAVAATAVMAFGVSSAQATEQSFSATFDDGNLNLPTLGTKDIVDATPATMDGTVEDTNGNLSVLKEDFFVPQFTGPVGIGDITATVDLSATEDITGNVNSATGVLTTSPSDYQAHVTLANGIDASCTYNLLDKSFSTAAGSPFSGDPFVVDTTGDWSITDGMMQMSWPSLPPSVEGASCAVVDSIVTAGCGGLEFANNHDVIESTCTNPPSGGGGNPTSPVNPAGNVRKRKCKKAKKHSASVSKKSKCKKKKK